MWASVRKGKVEVMEVLVRSLWDREAELPLCGGDSFGKLRIGQIIAEFQSYMYKRDRSLLSIFNIAGLTINSRATSTFRGIVCQANCPLVRFSLA